MPQPTKNAPDWIDVQNILGAIGNDYSLVVLYSTRIRGDKVETVGKAYGAPYTGEGQPAFVALVSWEVKRPKDMAQTFYTIAFDLWCQMDGGGATAAKRGPSYGWSGYVEVPKARRRQ